MTTSNSPLAARTKSVSAGNGPGHVNACATARVAIAGAITSRSSSVPSRPSSPACGLSPATAMRGDVMPNRGKRRRRQPDDARAIGRSSALAATSASGMCTVARTTRSFSDQNIIATSLDAAEMREQIGMAFPRQAGGGKRRLVDRRRGDGLHPPRQRVLGGAARWRRRRREPDAALTSPRWKLARSPPAMCGP